MFGIVHPFDQSLYEQDGHGNVKITQKDGRSGLYRVDGSYISGEEFDTDPQMCGWVGGPRAQHRLQSEPKIS